jgi:hypothetical protein
MAPSNLPNPLDQSDDQIVQSILGHRALDKLVVHSRLISPNVLLVVMTLATMRHHQVTIHALKVDFAAN